MAKIIFINPTEPRCGVHQYGLALFDILLGSKKHVAIMLNLSEKDLIAEEFNVWNPDVIMWNLHPLIPNPFGEGRSSFTCKQILVKHDPMHLENSWDRIIFSDPTAADRVNVRHIGRPLPWWRGELPHLAEFPLRVGLHGFGGAWGATMATFLVQNYDVSRTVFRVHLPSSPYVDPDGSVARSNLDVMQRILFPRGARIEATHHFMSTAELLSWLSQNHVNCYIRDKVHWVGVSSALDASLACGRPIAINKCEAFRHFWDCKPSICLEDRSLTDIIASGDEPLAPLRDKWSQSNILAQLEKVIDEVL